MFLQDCNIPLGLKAESTTYQHFYRFRQNQLLEYMMQLFTWSGFPESVPAHEVDTYLYLYGQCGINKGRISKDLIAVIPEKSGPTNYFDIFRNYTWATPLQGGRQYIGYNGVLIDNTLLHNSSYPLIHSTAAKLAHADTSLICALVNARDTVAMKVVSDKFRCDAEDFARKKYNGDPSIVLDKGFNTIQFADEKVSSNLNIREIADTEQVILSEFWENLGVNKTKEKRERMITTEADADRQLLKLNIRNMFECRKKGAEEVNAMFGLNVSVKCNVDLTEDNFDENEKEVKEDETADQN